jgi:hypothetical protein
MQISATVKTAESASSACVLNLSDVPTVVPTVKNWKKFFKKIIRLDYRPVKRLM